jgi:hypothetical protein
VKESTMFWSNVILTAIIFLLALYGYLGWENAFYWNQKWVNLYDKVHSKEDE